MKNFNSRIFSFILLSGVIFFISAQVNILSNAITYRTSSGQGYVTTHHGNMELSGNGTPNDVLKATNTSTTSSDRIGVHGLSLPAPYFGIGVFGEGGYVGVRGYATVAGTGARYGIDAQAIGGTPNYAVTGYANGSGTSTNYGISGTAYGTGTSTNYGIYGYASGGSVAYAGYFSGNVYCTGSYLPSDEKLKKNIMDLNGSLSKIMKLKAKTYEYDIENHPKMGLSQGKQIGLIAQDVETVLPEAVRDVPVTLPSDSTVKPEVDASGEIKITESIKAINYDQLIPVLVNAIQEQQAEIESLKRKLAGY